MNCLWRKKVCPTKFWWFKGLWPAPARFLTRHHGGGIGGVKVPLAPETSVPFQSYWSWYFLCPHLFSFSSLCACFVCMSISTLHACLVIPGGQKRVLSLLELELSMVGSHHVKVENWTRVHSKTVNGDESSLKPPVSHLKILQHLPYPQSGTKLPRPKPLCKTHFNQIHNIPSSNKSQVIAKRSIHVLKF